MLLLCCLEDDPADADAEIEERLKMWGHWKESKKKSSRSSKGKESKSSESKSEKHEEKTTKSVEVRDVGIQCCLGLLPDIWDVFHIPGSYSSSTSEQTEKARKVSGSDRPQ